MTRFVAVDGEADQEGRYILLCDSTGRELVNLDGITTRQALEFLLGLAGVKGREVVCFGLNYDVNQWLGDLGRRELQRIAVEGRTVWQLRYSLRWVPAKSLEISDRKTRRWVKVCEVFGFFQSSFVKALADWGFDPPAEIQTMKQRRGQFTAAELSRVIAYCKAECRLLVELMERLREACEAAGAVPAHNYWIGAGSIASALLRGQGVKAHHVYDRDLADRQVVEEGILGAYFGGRVELLAQGVLPVAHTRDIRSAYPHAATQLPSMANAKVKHRRRYRPGAAQAIWRVRWHDQAHGQLAPFPCRQVNGSICYPASGEGCYHAIEVATAVRLGYQVEVVEGWELICEERGQRPFDWIPSVYRHRAMLKARGDAAEKALKLGLNSVYGKLAQGYGHGQPPFQSYWWAGYITAATRARMLALAHRSGQVAMISTDGIFSSRPGTRGAQSGALGSWEPDRIESLFCAQPGVYRGVRGDRELVKSRGFFAREVDYDQLQGEWARRGVDGIYHYDSRRFIGLKVALHRNAMHTWRQWVQERRSISLLPDRKIIRLDELGDPVRDRRSGMILLYPLTRPVVSVAYAPKQSLYDDPQDADLENMIADDQPHYEQVNA